MTAKQYPDAASGAVGGPGPTYGYAGGGKLQTRTWARGITATYGYNSAGQLETVAYNDNLTPGVTNYFDRLGRTTSIHRGGVQIDRAIGLDGERLSESIVGGYLDGFAVTNQFDQFLRRTNLTLLDASAATIAATAYAYDAASRLKIVSDASVTTNVVSATYEYLPNASMIQEITFKNDAQTRMITTKGFDLFNRLETIAHTDSQLSTLSSFDYGHNLANQRTNSVLADGSYWEYAYDDLGQVISAKRYTAAGEVIAGQRFDYTMDDIGNRTNTKSGGDDQGLHLRNSDYAANHLNQYGNRTVAGYVDVQGSAPTSATVTVNGQIADRQEELFYRQLPAPNSGTPAWHSVNVTSITPGAGPGGADVVDTSVGSVFVPQTPEAFTYDADGNLKTDGRWTYEWDAENRLLAMQTLASLAGMGLPNNRLEFTYDYAGRRVSKTLLTWNPSSNSYLPSPTVLFAYDGWNPIATLNSIPSQSPTLRQTYFWGSDLSGNLRGAGGVGGLLAIKDAGTNGTHFVGYDGNGNVATMLDSDTETITAEYSYGPFGEQLQKSGSFADQNPFRFSTKYLDIESGFYYYGLRYYNPDTGRWLSRDPIGENGGANIYGFVGNNPVNAVDPKGLDVYVVYRKFNDPMLKKAYKLIGHFYLAFDNKNVDTNRWNCLVRKIGGQETPISRKADPTAETFSYHPWQVLVEQLETENQTSEHKTSDDGIIVTTVVTEGSFIGYNDAFDKKQFRSDDPEKFKLNITQEEQYGLYRVAIASRDVNNESRLSGDFGNYALLLNNCGSWAREILRRQGVSFPDELISGNTGAGIGGLGDSLILPRVMTAGAAIYGYTKKGNVEKGFGEALDTIAPVLGADENGALLIRIINYRF